MRTTKNRISFGRLSIQQRLPLLICAFLLSAIVIYGFANYYSLRKATLTIAKDRIGILTNQISTMFGQSAQGALQTEHNTAAQNSVVKCVKSGGKDFRVEALAELDKLHLDSTWVSIELLDQNLVPVLSSNKSTVHVNVNTKDVLAFTHVGPDSGSVGKIYRIGDTMYYPVIASVTEEKHIIGYIICWQWLRVTPKAVAQFSQLIGTGTTLYIANTDGSLWTDLLKPIPALPLKSSKAGEPIEYTGVDGRLMMMKVQPVPNTGWLAAIAFSEQNILEGVNSFMNWIFIFGALLTTVGILAAWIMSRNITRPLNQLTAAARTISKGNYSSPITISVNRHDELGELANAFNMMTAQIYQMMQGLEVKVKERTTELQEEIKLRKISEESLRISSQRYHQLVKK